MKGLVLHVLAAVIRRAARWSLALLLRPLGDHGLGGQQQRGARRRVLQRRPLDLRGITHTGLPAILDGFGLAVIATRALPSLHPVDRHRSLFACVASHRSPPPLL